MEQVLQTVLAFAVILLAVLSFVFSIMHRRTRSPERKGLLQARMNISMGLMLMAIAAIQILLFESSTVRIIVGTVFLLLGLFNLFAGLKNHAFFSRMAENRKNEKDG